MNQTELARRAGVSRKWVYEFESGKPTAELGLLLRVLDALGLSLSVTPRRDVRPGEGGDAIDLDALLQTYRRR